MPASVSVLRAASALTVGALLMTIAGAHAAVAASAVPAPPSIPTQVLAPVTPSAGDEVPASTWLASLDTALSATALGSDVAGLVIDAANGKVLYSRFPNRTQQPASTIKILTAITALKAFGPDARLRTSVLSGDQAGHVVLTGGGDSTLARTDSAAAGWPAGQGAHPATLSQLAVRTAASLHKAGITSVHLDFDDSLFTGDHLAPGWKSSFVAAGVVSPVMALSADGGRTAADASSRSVDPAQSAAEYFAERLRALGVAVARQVTRVPGPSRSMSSPSQTTPASTTSAAPSSTVLASVDSPPMVDLVERLLTRSDDDLAEALGHLAGGKLVGSASFKGGVQATLDTLEQLGVSMKGTQLADASGLSALNELDPETFTQTLSAVVANKPFIGSSVGTMWPVASGLPIAGVTGTLSDRFSTPKTLFGRGIVRAKTGTLTGVVGLAGMVRDAHGRVLIFDFDADRAPGPVAEARAAVDRAATIVATG